MKKTFYLFLTCCFLQFVANAQLDRLPPKQQGFKPNLQGLKIAYITRQLSLTSEEAQKFWPVYYEFVDKAKKIKDEQKDDIIGFEEKILVERKKLKVDMKKILGTEERANKALTIDRDFNNEVKKELDKRLELKEKRKLNNQ
jgi:hypothetical protein